jgi:chromatin remodeling complex protein RSC6
MAENDFEKIINFNSETESLDESSNVIKDEILYNEIKKRDVIINNLYKNLINTIKDLRIIKNDFKKLRSMNIKIDNKVDSKIISKRKNDKPKGFYQECEVPDKLCKLLKLEEGTKMRRNEITKKIHELLKERNLKYEKDHRIFRADKELIEVFELSKNVNEQTNISNPNTFSQFSLQKNIAKIYKEHRELREKEKLQVKIDDE